MFKHIGADLKAGLVVFLVALPLCLGIAVAQGVEPLSGLIAGVVGGIIVSLISGSNLSVSGPAAGLTATVLVALYPEKFGLFIPPLRFEAFLVSLIIAGGLQVFLGIIRAGIIGHYIPGSVIKGMLSGIGVILIIKQIPHFFGYDSNPEGDFQFFQADGENTFSEIAVMLNNVSYGALLAAVGSLLVLLFWGSKAIQKNKVLGFLPGPLMAVIIGVLISLGLKWFFPILEIKPEHLVDMPDLSTFEKLKASIKLPDFNELNNTRVWEVGITLGIIASIESLLGVEAVDKLDPDFNVTPTNRELIAQGAGNIICGLIGGLPVTSVIVRSSANVNAGGKTKLSSIFHGILLLVSLFMIPGLIEMVPLSALAAILILTGWRLAKPTKNTTDTLKAMFLVLINRLGIKAGNMKEARKIMKEGIPIMLPFIVTLIVMLFTDLLKGVAVGMFVGIVFILRQNFKDPFRLLVDDIDGQKNYFVRLPQNVTFINKGKFVQFFHSVEPGSKVTVDGGRSNFIDQDILELITEFKYSSQLKNIEVVLEDIKEVEILSKH